MKITNPTLQEIKDTAGLTCLQDIALTLASDGLSRKEIAERMSRSTKAIEHLLYRSFRKIRKRCDDLGLSAGDLGQLVV